ncbi:SusD/RagB family nutrient-binding outer membrane lipoprotein [Chryseobacterium gotjawalense]|uniref:SusD/RagB family nutrient-binding outer membrane lipoprotein n=1 Tax=Chryseobacterium gotjawalense TaxID=3042315 RepID=A0ABY8RC26_9FLAO|nr:SusD/RagB family nutrient-binding outer membrane lipoprotein [Chryseobacterium sp. wdc7]WHF51044.1 SusD/RagB family nutrient-binding outer membrane lipoprotein [Chryseobacterium sp. wdc7]
MKKYILLSFVGLALVSCRLDDNLNPNKVLADQATPGLRLSGASVTAYAVQAGTMNGLGNAWTNAWSGNFATFGNPFTTESNLDITTTYRQTIFTDTYKAVTRFQRIIDFGATAPNYVAIAKIQKAYYMQILVDLYGNIPFSEAFKESDNPTPKYDKDVDIYKALVAELLEARALIASTPATAAFKVEATSDPIFKGNMVKWNEFCNTVMLKYAIHLANTTNADGIALRNQIISALAGASYISGDVTINPGYSNASADTQNPLYLNFGRLTYAGAVDTQAYQLMTASDHAVKSLQGDPSKITSGVTDSRIGYLFTTGVKYNGTAAGGATGYYGFPQGMTNDDYKVFLGYTVNDRKPVIGNFSFLGGNFVPASGASANGFLMLRSESEFLQAEAALRGYAGFAGDQAHFEQGIRYSFIFDYTQVDPAAANTTAANAAATAYIASAAAKVKVGWAGTVDNKIAAIQYQRWVALMNYNGIESYINYLRTGYPETPLATTTVKANKPWRLLYPSAEYSSNSANVPVVSQAEVFTKNATTPFIYK